MPKRRSKSFELQSQSAKDIEPKHMIVMNQMFDRSNQDIQRSDTEDELDFDNV